MLFESLGAHAMRRMLARTGIAIAVVSGLAGSSLVAAAEQAAPTTRAAPSAFSTNGRPRIGLVLSGGGAKGFAHIGVIEELERRHIPIDAISGTSMGAVVGSMYAIGNDADGIKALASSIDWVTVFSDRQNRQDLTFRRKREVRDILLNARLGVVNGKPALPKGVMGGQRLFATVQEILAPWRATEDFDKLPIPFRAVAANIVTGDAVVMGSGNLSTAVFASMSIPSGFPPVEREGLLLVDGMIADNLPVDVARAMGVDVAIVVDVGEPPRASPDKINSVVDVISQMQSLLGWESIRRQRASISGRDVLIDPDISGLSVTGFNNYELGIERGRAAAQQAGDRLAGLSVSDAQWATYLAERKARTNPAPIRIESVRIVNTSNLPDEIVAPLITTRPGDTLDGAIMARDVARIFALDEFERVDYSIDVAPGANALVVNAKGGRAADKYFMAGMVLGSNFGKSSTFELAVSFTDRDFLGTGAEWRGYGRVGNDMLFDVSLFKQFGRFQQTGRVFVEPVAYFQKFSALVTQQGSSDSVAALQSLSAGAGVDGGVIFGNWLELRGGVRIGGVNPSDAGGNTGLPPGWSREVDWRVGATIDTLDSVTFPRAGNLVQLQYIDRVSALGGEFRRNTFTANLLKPFSWDRTTILVGGRLGTTSNAINSNLGDFQLGGFLNLSGLQRNSLIGQQLLFGRVVGYHRIGDKSPIFDLPIYLGGSFEAGNVWTRTSDISLGNLRTSVSAFIAADTPIGPAWFAFGQSGSNTSVYLVLGRLF